MKYPRAMSNARHSLVQKLALSLLVVALHAGCGDDGNSDSQDLPDAGLDDPSARPNYSEDWDRDILSYHLQLDLDNRRGVASIEIAGSQSTGFSLDIGSLQIESVSDSYGMLSHLALVTELLVGVPAGGESRRIDIEYSFISHTDFDGWDDNADLSFLWPAFCGNLFPCNPAPHEGASFTMEVRSKQAGQLVYPSSIPADAPSYMPAIAQGEYTEEYLGQTEAGTEVSVWYEPGQGQAAIAGTENLVAVFDFLEQTYGPYTFGNKVGTVSADWGEGDFGGMEHHPYWHVARGSLDDEETNAHEAAHGWYGNGVRIACWEDFVLSEGVVTYMAARSLAESGVDLWPDYDCKLKEICNGPSNTTALLQSCNEIDLINHDLWSTSPYQKGAQYFREVAAILGEDTLDQALSEFYAEHVGESARMRELVELLKSKGNSEEIEAITVEWLESEACPQRVQKLCPPS